MRQTTSQSLDDRLPLSSTDFGRICKATPVQALEIVADMSEDTRARIALFCYARTHLRQIGQAIASRCSERALAREGGEAGRMLYEQSTGASDTWRASRSFSLRGSPDW